ncbi:hypothetical protein [Sneathiella chinensis]|nr:hypothetical protein [Sneathiella chinensis]
MKHKRPVSTAINPLADIGKNGHLSIKVRGIRFSKEKEDRQDGNKKN